MKLEPGQPPQVETTHVVLPPHTNAHGSAFGGQIMAWMDIIAGICSARHCKGPAVTVSVDELVFNKPIRLGDIVVMKANLNYVGHTSMEVGVRVESENARTGQVEHCLSGYFTFVAIDAEGKPKEVPGINSLFMTPEQLNWYDQAKERVKNRLEKRKWKTT